VDQCYSASLLVVAGHTNVQFLQADCVVAGPESVQPAHSLWRASAVTHDRRVGEATSIITKRISNMKKIEFNIPSKMRTKFADIICGHDG